MQSTTVYSIYITYLHKYKVISLFHTAKLFAEVHKFIQPVFESTESRTINYISRQSVPLINHSEREVIFTQVQFTWLSLDFKVMSSSSVIDIQIEEI